MRLAIAALAALLFTCAIAQSPPTHQHGFGDAAHWAKMFDDPSRDVWQKPHEVITALAPTPDALVADIGAGTGYFSLRLAHFVPRGRVYGVDAEPAMVAHLAQRARDAGLSNLRAVSVRADDAQLPEPVDLVLLVDVAHHIDARAAYFRKLRASLKAGARVAIIDFNPASPQGPPRAERLPPDLLKAEMAAAGYRVAAEPSFLPYQYFIVFTIAP